MEIPYILTRPGAKAPAYATPGAAALAQPFYCTEAGNFYGRAHFATARTDKESYLLFIRCPAPV